MTENEIGREPSKLWRSLQLLSQDKGIWRTDLLELLQVESLAPPNQLV